jgi:hypothetical protein
MSTLWPHSSQGVEVIALVLGLSSLSHSDDFFRRKHASWDAWARGSGTDSTSPSSGVGRAHVRVYQSVGLNTVGPVRGSQAAVLSGLIWRAD